MSDAATGTPRWRRLGRPGVIGGALALAIGLWVMSEAAGYPLGTSRRMGPGYFPMLLGGLMAAMGAALCLLGFARGTAPGADDERPDPRALIAVLAGLAAFALMLPRAGLVPAVVGLVLVAAQGSGQMRMAGSMVLALFLAALSWAIFRLGLGLPLPAFGGSL